MNKLLVIAILMAVAFIGCEKQYDTPITASEGASIRVNSVSAITLYQRTEVDSLLPLSVSIVGKEAVESVYAELYFANEKVNKEPILLLDNGNANNGDNTLNDGVYSARYVMNFILLSGDYRIVYFVKDKNRVVSKLAEQNFEYDSGKDNLAPVISNLICTDTLTVAGAPVVGTAQVKAFDPNGFADIASVFYTVTRPNGTSNGTRFVLDFSVSDSTFKGVFYADSNNTKGTYRFDFQAQDKRKKYSNILSQSVTIR